MGDYVKTRIRQERMACHALCFKYLWVVCEDKTASCLDELGVEYSYKYVDYLQGEERERTI